jgi:hypothetical protein
MHRMMAAPSTDTRPVVGDQANMARLQGDYDDLFMEHGVRGGGGGGAWLGGKSPAPEGRLQPSI